MLPEPFQQVCVWPGTILEKDQVGEFEQWVADEFGTRVKYLETVVTGPDLDENGKPVLGTGGRHDLMFAVHSEDVGKFAVPRLKAGMRWLEDIYLNGHGHIYPDRVKEQYWCWPE